MIFRKHFLDSKLYDAADPQEIEDRFLTHVKSLIGQFVRKKDADGTNGNDDGEPGIDGTLHVRRQRRYGVRGFKPSL